MRSLLYFLLPLYLLAGELSITKTAVREVEPNEFTLTFSVLSESSLAEAALKQTRETAEAIVKALQRKGTLTTEQFQLYPVNHEKKETSFRAVHTMRLKSDKLSELGAIIDEATRLGASEIRSLLFSNSNQRGIEDELLKEAVAAAEREAALVATIKGVKSIRIDGGGATFKAMQFLPGSDSLSRTVEMVFKIE